MFNQGKREKPKEERVRKDMVVFGKSVRIGAHTEKLNHLGGLFDLHSSQSHCTAERGESKIEKERWREEGTE